MNGIINHLISSGYLNKKWSILPWVFFTFLWMPQFIYPDPSENLPISNPTAAPKILPEKHDKELTIPNSQNPAEPNSAKVVSHSLFAEQIFPILQKRCIQCHNSDLANNGLDLSTRSALLKGGKSGPAMVPGNSHGSLLFQLVNHEKEPNMPFGADKLPDNEISLIKTWIDQGAVWPEAAGAPRKHWAYEPPQEPKIPEVSDPNWCRNPLDYFILDKLNSLGLKPSPEADKAALIRRLSLDLIGLPPQPADLDRFLADPSPTAYEALVNRLLSSSHFGERWATHWMDLSRYADSNGYEKDRQREMWAYREWVINAFNRDMPYDQFTIEQLAGDLLPGANLEQKIATGFSRNTMINEEGGVNQEEYRINAVIDRTNTTSTIWMGSTLGCAQCHNHKYDPFTQKDYYRLFAFFNNTKQEVNQIESFEAISNGPLVYVPKPEQQKIISQTQPQIEQLNSQLYRETEALTQAQREWEKKTLADAFEWHGLLPQNVHSEFGADLSIKSDNSILAGGINPVTDTYIIKAETHDSNITGIRLEFMPDESLPQDGPGRRAQSRFTLSELQVYAKSAVSVSSEVPITLTNPSADWESKDSQISETIDGKLDTGWGNGSLNSRIFEAVFQTPELETYHSPTQLKFVLQQMKGAGENIGRFRLSVTTNKSPKANPVPKDVLALLSAPTEKRTAGENKKVLNYFRKVTPLLQPLRDQIAALESHIPGNMAATLVMEELSEARKSHIFQKGNYRTLSEEVHPGVPAIFTQLPEGKSYNRLDLARWLVSGQNPLFARAAVNRIWEQLFGYGIVKTTEDFGTRSERPVNQELLDWLALRFKQEGWSLKSLLYVIVTSSAYRQSSVVNPDLLEADPENRYVARGPRFRLGAELVRDNALAISGLLNPTVGGASVFPYQPEGIWRMPYSSDQWVMSKNGDQYRRGLYTHWQRTASYPTFINFDATSRETSCTRRVRTNTPLQALDLLNDPAFFDMARGLADRIMQEIKGTTVEQLQYGFRLCTARNPSEIEIKLLKDFYQDMLDHFRAHPKETLQVIQKENLKTDVDIYEHAAWIVTANVLLNLDETITKG